MAFNSISVSKRIFLMHRYILITGSLLGAFTVILGALGSHLLEPYLNSVSRLATYETAIQYQFYHVFLILFIGLLYGYSYKAIIHYAFYTCVLGILLFSGSLYILCLTNNSTWGLLTPLGGVSLICSWLLLFLSIKKNRK